MQRYNNATSRESQRWWRRRTWVVWGSSETTRSIYEEVWNGFDKWCKRVVGVAVLVTLFFLLFKNILNFLSSESVDFVRFVASGKK